jgi:hypothetical protein
MKTHNTKPYLFVCLSVTICLLLSACSVKFPFLRAATPSPLPSLTPTQSPTLTAQPTVTPTSTPILTPTQTPSATIPPTATLTSTPVMTATFTPTPTTGFPTAVILMQAFCNYGPGKAYLYAHGLYPDDEAVVEGRNYSGTWLWIKPENLGWNCWAAASVMEVTGDVMKLHVVTSWLPHSTLYGPPGDVQAMRQGDQVKITWDRVWMTKDDNRGYLVEANVCQGGMLIPVAVHTDDITVTIQDGPGCSERSSGKLYTVEKHGYTDPVDIPWP